MLFAIDLWHQTKYARLLQKLDSYVEGGGRTVLDNSVIMYSNELSNGRAHSFMNLPYILAGSAGGYFKQGENIRLGATQNPDGDDDIAPHNKLLNTIINSMGVQSDWFGAPEDPERSLKGGVYDELLA
jgi:hypothetical protein